MDFYETIKKITGNSEMKNAECLDFAISQWGLVCLWLS